MHETRSGDWSPELSDEEKETLFRIAEDTLEWIVNGAEGPFDFGAYSLTAKLREEMATFVTLKENGMLRGCIGSLAPVAPLYRSVHDNAVNAASRDFRFQPVQPAELPLLDTHISILSPIVPIASLREFHVGEHGIILQKGMHRAVFLPEVAVEQGWNTEQTLAALCQKAGLPVDAWKSGMKFQVFSSVVLSRNGG